MNPMNPMNMNVMNTPPIPIIPPNMPLDKVEIINYLMNQNMTLQNQIQMNINLIQKIIQKEMTNIMKNDINLNNSEITYPYFFEYLGPKINIMFHTSSNYKYSLSVPCSVPISKLLSAFITFHGFSEDLIDKEIKFLYNGIKINKDEKRTVAEFFLRGGYIITVFDITNYFRKFVK